jgi:hypothetical protein
MTAAVPTDRRECETTGPTSGVLLDARIFQTVKGSLSLNKKNKDLVCLVWTHAIWVFQKSQFSIFVNYTSVNRVNYFLTPRPPENGT